MKIGWTLNVVIMEAELTSEARKWYLKQARERQWSKKELLDILSILIEKPLAMTAAEGQKVVEHCKEKGVLIAAGFMMRFGACIQAMKKGHCRGKNR